MCTKRDIKRPDCSSRILFPIMLFQFFPFFVGIWGCSSGQSPPYPPSPVISEISWDMSSHRTAAPGSDNWPTTWADDDHIYTSWGDGGGFGGTNDIGRVSLGVARIQGDWNALQAVNVWGGHQAEHPAQFPGKSYGILSVDDVIYMWVNIQDQDVPQYRQCQLTFSTDHAASFKKGFRFAEPDAAFSVCTFLNFGKAYKGARDNYVYIYSGQPLDGCIERCLGRDVYLARVPKDKILQRASYEFFAGMDNDRKPVWKAQIKDRKPVFSDDNGAGTRLGVVFNPGLKRYLMTIAHNDEGGLGIFEAAAPWGPWTTVAYYENWLNFGYSPSYHFAPAKWISEDGKKMVLVWSSNDQWNSISGHLTLREQ